MLPGVFENLPAEAEAQVLSLGRSGRWARGEILFHPEDQAETLYLLTRGGARLYRLGRSAREVTLDVHGPGDLLGVQALLPGGQWAAERYGLYAEALDDTEALLLGQDTLARLRQLAPAFAVTLNQQLVQQTQQVQGRLAGLVFLEVSQRLALALLTLAEREGDWNTEGKLALRERVSHQDLAHMVGSTRETITKLLGDFRNKGLLDLGYRRLILTDHKGLLALAREPLR